MTTRKQEGRKPDGTFDKGYKPPTTFADRPNDRHSGAWKKEDTLRFKIEKASFLSKEELQSIIDDPNESMLLIRFAQATLNADWRMVREITEMLYGKPKESVDISNQDGSLTPIIRIIDERPKSS